MNKETEALSKIVKHLLENQSEAYQATVNKDIFTVAFKSCTVVFFKDVSGVYKDYKIYYKDSLITPVPKARGTFTFYVSELHKSKKKFFNICI